MEKLTLIAATGRRFSYAGIIQQLKMDGFLCQLLQVTTPSVSGSLLPAPLSLQLNTASSFSWPLPDPLAYHRSYYSSTLPVWSLTCFQLSVLPSAQFITANFSLSSAHHCQLLHTFSSPLQLLPRISTPIKLLTLISSTLSATPSFQLTTATPPSHKFTTAAPPTYRLNTVTPPSH